MSQLGQWSARSQRAAKPFMCWPSRVLVLPSVMFSERQGAYLGHASGPMTRFRLSNAVRRTVSKKLSTAEMPW
jgi:hypothetical protein